MQCLALPTPTYIIYILEHASTTATRTTMTTTVRASSRGFVALCFASLLLFSSFAAAETSGTRGKTRTDLSKFLNTNNNAYSKAITMTPNA
uniref:Uncharacterized protein n=1 Tax=Setaria italica TaxID=4555 RepID=K3YM54_SETIT